MYELYIPVINKFIVNEPEHCGSDEGNRCAYLEVYAARCGRWGVAVIRDGEHHKRIKDCIECFGTGERVPEPPKD